MRQISLSAIIISSFLALSACDDLNRTMPLNELHRAASNNDLRKIDEALARGNHVDVTDEFGNTALHFAATYGKVDAIRRLTERGADVNKTDRTGRTPLHLAAPQNEGVVFYRKYLESMEVLVNAGARLNDQDYYGDTPIHRAVYWHCVENVRFLRSRGADLSVRNHRNETPGDLARKRLKESEERLARHHSAGRSDLLESDYESIDRARNMIAALEG